MALCSEVRCAAVAMAATPTPPSLPFSRRRLGETYRSLQAPVYFFLGRHDWNVPSILAARYLKRIDAPYKRLVWFEHSAHPPPFEEPEKFVEGTIEIVRPHATGSDR